MEVFFVFPSEGNSRTVSLLWAKCCLSIESSLRPFDEFCIKLEEREADEVAALPGFYLSEIFAVTDIFGRVRLQYICRLDCIVILQ